MKKTTMLVELNWLLQISFFQFLLRHFQLVLIWIESLRGMCSISCRLTFQALFSRPNWRQHEIKLSVIRTHNDLISRQSTSNWSWIIRRLFWLTIPVLYWAKRGALYLGRCSGPRESSNKSSPTPIAEQLFSIHQRWELLAVRIPEL